MPGGEGLRLNRPLSPQEHDMDVINWPDVEGRAAIHLAAAHQNSAKVKVLLSTGRCNISLMDNIGRSPLHWAAVLGKHDQPTLWK